MTKKTLDTLIDDVYDLFEPNDHVPLEDNVEHLGNLVARAAHGAVTVEERDGSLRASNVGRPCDRQLWFEVNNFPRQPMESSAHLKFFYGHVIEASLLFLAAEAGHTIEYVQEEVELDGIKGHIDCVIDGVTVDVKSASSYSFRKFQDGTLVHDDPFGYMGQLAFYKEAMEEKHGIKEAAFLAMDKQLGYLTLYKPTEKELRDVRIRDRIKFIKEVVDDTAIPPRPFTPVPDGKSGNMQLCVQCRYCPYKFPCWEDANGDKGLRVFLYSTGPRYLTYVHNTPRVEEIT